MRQGDRGRVEWWGLGGVSLTERWFGGGFNEEAEAFDVDDADRGVGRDGGARSAGAPQLRHDDDGSFRIEGGSRSARVADDAFAGGTPGGAFASVGDDQNPEGGEDGGDESGHGDEEPDRDFGSAGDVGDQQEAADDEGHNRPDAQEPEASDEHLRN